MRPAIGLFIIAMFILLFIVVKPAKPGTMDYCRPYAAAVAQTVVNFAWLRAYSACLNDEADPRQPEPPDWRGAMCVILPGCEFAIPGSVPATASDKPVSDPEKPEPDPDCKRRHPRSYDAQTQTYHTRKNGKWVRVPC